jgi:antirestriction protein ArdC
LERKDDVVTWHKAEYHHPRCGQHGISRAGSFHGAQHVSFASHAYSQEELVAEFGAAMLCGKAGIATKTIENSAAYIKLWERKLTPEMLIFGSREARKAFDYVIDKAAEEEVAA